MATFNDRETQTVVTVHRPEEDYDPRHEGVHSFDIAATLGQLVADITILPKPLSCIFFHLLTLELRKLHLRVMTEGSQMLDRAEAVAEERGVGREDLERDLNARLQAVFEETDAVIRQLMSEEQSWASYRERYAEMREMFAEVARVAARTGLPEEVVAVMMLAGGDAPEDLPFDITVLGDPEDKGKGDLGDPDLGEIFAEAGLDDEDES